jgi:hypothetical protein
VRLFVDDYRPAPEGWHLAKTITEAVRLLSGVMYFEAVSLDHDIIYREGKHSFSEENFSTVARYIAIMPKDRLPEIVYVHTSNPRGANDMEEILKEIVPTKRVGDSTNFDFAAPSTYKEDLIREENERTVEHDGNTPHCGCCCRGCLGLIPGTNMYKINDFPGEF